MAYNPFNVFRRNQKTLFAILTIIIMIVFTLSFGAGDFFQWLPTLLGKSGNKGEPVAKVNGSKIYEGDLQKINLQRYLASEFMIASNAIAAQKVETTLTESLANVSKELRPQILQLRQIREGNSFLKLPYVFQQQDLMEALQNPQSQNFLVRRGINQLRQFVNAMMSKPENSREDNDVLKTFATLINLDAQRMDAAAGYFGHKAEGDDTLKSALDYDLWLKEADKLGIKYSEKDAQQMYLDEFYGQTDAKSLAEMEKNMFSSKQGYSRDTIFKSLADEFRVRTCQSVVLGRNNALQTFATPWDSYEYYRKLCNGGTYAMITVPAENFLAKVTGTPGEGEMRKLFDAYRNREADPAKDNLGLRDPRKLKIGWLEVKGDEAFYKKLGAEALAAAEVHARTFAAAMVPMPGGGLGLIATPAVFNLQDPALAGAYATFKNNYNTTLDTAWFPLFSPNGLASSGPIDSSVLMPGIIAATAGIAASSFATHAGPLPIALLFAEKSRNEDRVARARALTTLFSVPTTGGSFLLGPSLALAGYLPPPLPLAVVRTELLEKVRAEAVRTAAERDLLNFESELGKLAAKPDLAEAKAYLAKFIAERGLKSGESKDFDNQWTIGKDPGLQPLIDKAEKTNPNPGAPLMFGQSFFYERDPGSMDFRNPRMRPTTSYYVARPFPDAANITLRDEPVYMAWNMAEVPAETPRDFEKTKPKIVELWKRIESRKLAAAAAEEIANEVRASAKAEGLDTRPEDLSTTPLVEKIVSEVFLKSQSRYPSYEDKERATQFQIEDVAPISMPQSLFATQQVQPRPFQLLPRKALPYPTFQMQQELLANKDGKPATTLVLNEESKDRYYVAVLKHRQDRRSSEFYEQVYNGVGPLSNEVRGALQNEEMRAAYRQSLALMRAEFKVEVLNEKLK